MKLKECIYLAVGVRPDVLGLIILKVNYPGFLSTSYTLMMNILFEASLFAFFPPNK